MILLLKEININIYFEKSVQNFISLHGNCNSGIILLKYKV